MSVFSKIISGEIPSHKIAETEDYLAFLDINPVATGHTLVIPKKAVSYIFDLDDETYVGLMLFSKMVAAALEKSIVCERIGMSVIGLEIKHTHVHLVPINEFEDMNFSKLKTAASESELRNLAGLIRSNLN